MYSSVCSKSFNDCTLFFVQVKRIYENNKGFVTFFHKISGEAIAIHGAEAARQLQLTTQMPMRLILYTSGNTREVKIKNQTVLLKHISPSKLIVPGTLVETVISALLYLGQEQVSLETIKKIQKQLSNEEFNTVLKEVNYMPAWMANIFYYFQKVRSHE